MTVGLILNIALGASKLAVGIVSDMTSVTSDAFNNLSDAAVSVVTIIATALAARAADHDHPFGHGRYEYIATFILGAAITAVGAEVLINGAERAIEPVAGETSVFLFAVLGAAVAVKAVMFGFYCVYGRKCRSDAIKAAAVDSASDAGVTAVVLVCAIVQKYTGAIIDGYVSIAVAVVILIFAVRILKHTVGRLLGARPDPQLYDKIKRIISDAPQVMSMHDLMINDYGASKKIAEVDAVFSADMTFVEVHDVCDELERKVYDATGVKLCVHADPYIVGDVRLAEMRETIDGVVGEYGASAHDIYIDDENGKVTLDVTVPDDKVSADEIKTRVEACVRETLPYDVEICMDYI